MKTTPTTVPTADSIMNPSTLQGLLYRESARAVRCAIRFALPYCEGNALTRLYGLHTSAYHVASVLSGISTDDSPLGECCELVQTAVLALAPYVGMDDFVAFIHTQNESIGFTRTGKALTPFTLAVRACSRYIHGERKRSKNVYDDLTLQAIMARPDDCLNRVMLDDFSRSLSRDLRAVFVRLLHGERQVDIARSLGVSQVTISKRLKSIRSLWEEYAQE